MEKAEPAPGADAAVTPTGGTQPGHTLANRIEYLFTVARPRGRGEYTLDEAAAGMAEHGVSVSAAYLSQLRQGHRTNPRQEVLVALSAFFGINPAYFIDDETAERVAAQLELYRVLRDKDVRAVAGRLADLSPEGLQILAGIIDHFRALERGTARTTPHDDQPD
jgi:transcriptional regulator with XRE-family HTH domain